MNISRNILMLSLALGLNSAPKASSQGTEFRSVGRIVRIHGDARIDRGSKHYEARLIEEALDGDIVMVQPGADFEFHSSTGARWSLEPSSSYRIFETKVVKLSGFRAVVLPSLTRLGMSLVVTHEVSGKGLAQRLRGPNLGIHPTGAARSWPIRISWQLLSDADQYHVRVTRDGTTQELLVTDLPASQSTLTLTESVLPRGIQADVAIEAQSGGRVIARESIQVWRLTSRDERAVAAAEANAKWLRSEPYGSFKAHLLLSEVYEAAGLLSQAVTEYTAVAALNPNDEWLTAKIKDLKEQAGL